MPEEGDWVLVSSDGHDCVDGFQRTFRTPVPGGWLYRVDRGPLQPGTNIATGPVTVALCFVPNPKAR